VELLTAWKERLSLKLLVTCCSLDSQNLGIHDLDSHNPNPNPNTNLKPNTNPNPNKIRSTNPVLTVQISPGNFTVQILTVQISSGYRNY